MVERVNGRVNLFLTSSCTIIHWLLVGGVEYGHSVYIWKKIIPCREGKDSENVKMVLLFRV